MIHISQLDKKNLKLTIINMLIVAQTEAITNSEYVE